MPTNARGSTARQNPTQQVGYLRKHISFDGGLSGTLPPLPDGAILVSGDVYVHTPFNDGTANTVNIGIEGEADRYMSAGSLAAAAIVSFDDLVIGNSLVSSDQAITYNLTQTAGDATTGSADIVITYIPNNDG